MATYRFAQWVLFFFLYGFVGWCFESALVSITQRKPTNRGFIKGPFLPIYGTGAIGILFATRPAGDNLILIFLLGMLAATTLELVTGACMERLFKIRYWDYSDKRINYKGYISLLSSLLWGGFSVLLVKVIHAPMEALVLLIPENAANVIALLAAAAFAMDFGVAFKTAIDLRDVLAAAEAVKKELASVRERLAGFEEKVEGVYSAAEDGWREKKELLETRLDRERILQYFRDSLSKDKLRLLKRHPTARSRQYGEELDLLRGGRARRMRRMTKRGPEKAEAAAAHTEQEHTEPVGAEPAREDSGRTAPAEEHYAVDI